MPPLFLFSIKNCTNPHTFARQKSFCSPFSMAKQTFSPPPVRKTGPGIPEILDRPLGLTFESSWEFCVQISSDSEKLRQE